MSITTGGAFPGGSYLAGAMPTEEQLAYAAEREKKGPRNIEEEGHDVFVGMDADLKIGWDCRTCRETQTDFVSGIAAAESAQAHAGPKGRVGR